jgi:hypothetical protein
MAGWTPPRAGRLSRIDEDWQIAQWGEDEEAADVAARKYTRIPPRAAILGIGSRAADTATANFDAIAHNLRANGRIRRTPWASGRGKHEKIRISWRA